MRAYYGNDTPFIAAHHPARRADRPAGRARRRA